jgi:4-amino-4-deoxy-L-arabinose transferase-like glycosyltransferase
MRDLILKLIKGPIEFITRHEILCLFALVYLIYNINGRTIGSGDTIPASFLPFSILENHNLYLDQYYNYFNSTFQPPYFVSEIGGHYLSTYPIVTPVLVTPLYVMQFLFFKLNHYPLDMYSSPGFAIVIPLMEKLSGSLIATLSVIFVFFSVKELINRRTAAVVAIIYAFATNTWTISSQGLWQQGLVELLLAMSIYLVLLNEKHKSDKIIIGLGILSGLFLFNRPVDSILLMSVVYYVLELRDRRIVYYILGVFLSGSPFLFYNLHYFGNLFGGYSVLIGYFDIGPGMITRLTGLLISPSRGLFVYTPITLFSLLGYFKTFKAYNSKIKNFLLILGFSVLSQIVVYGAFKIWWAGWSYGPRFLTGTLPALALFFGLYIKHINFDMKNRWNLLVVSIFSILLLWSVFVQIVGAFYYPNGGWDGNPISVDLHPERAWDWKDTQIMRSFDAGIIPPGNYINALQTIVNLPRDIVMDGKLGKGWYGIETWDGTSTRWMENDAQVTIYSPENRTANLSLRITSFYRTRTLDIYIGNKLAAVRGNISSAGFENTTVLIHLVNGTNSMRFHVPEGCERPSDKPELKNRDSRCLSLAFQNITIIP